ncbi:helix-turn-helix domain-containing protein [Bacteriovoracaceae bacterium]|nr:helix-turn-helix domain-containing protein [Bacteriovoracaceae bacterium]
MKNKSGDMTVGEAAEVLGVTTRSVLNYIKAKEIDAIKVGKSWYIKKASLDAFSITFGISRDVVEESKKKEKPEKEFPKDKENKESSENRFSVKNLRLFIKASDILGSLNLKDVETDHEMKRRLDDLTLSAIELLGAGYYSFEPKNKMGLYNQSRQKVGAILTLAYFRLRDNNGIKKILMKLKMICYQLTPH